VGREQHQVGRDRARKQILGLLRLVALAVDRRHDQGRCAVAAYLVLLAAHGCGLAGYWRSVPLLDSPAGRAALELDDAETPIGLLHLGRPRQEQRVPERAPVAAFTRYLP